MLLEYQHINIELHIILNLNIQQLVSDIHFKWTIYILIQGSKVNGMYDACAWNTGRDKNRDF